MVIDKLGSVANYPPPAMDGSAPNQAAIRGSGQSLPAAVAHSTEEVGKAANAANRRMELAESQIRFNVTNESGRTVVKMVDTQTKEVLLQIPNEQMMQIAQNLDKIQGLAVQKRA